MTGVRIQVSPWQTITQEVICEDEHRQLWEEPLNDAVEMARRHARKHGHKVAIAESRMKYVDPA